MCTCVYEREMGWGGERIKKYHEKNHWFSIIPSYKQTLDVSFFNFMLIVERRKINEYLLIKL